MVLYNEFLIAIKFILIYHFFIEIQINAIELNILLIFNKKIEYLNIICFYL